MALSTEKIPHICCVYNPHSAIASLNVAMRSAGFLEESLSIEKRIKENAVPLLESTRAKLLTLQREDGSFSYDPSGNCCASQGQPIALKGALEGDVNATTIAMGGAIGCVFTNLGIQQSFFDKDDLDIFLAEISSLKPRKKLPRPVASDKK